MVLTLDTREPQRLSAYLAQASHALCGGLMQLCLAEWIIKDNDLQVEENHTYSQEEGTGSKCDAGYAAT